MSEPLPALHVTSIGDGSRTVVFLHGLLGQGRNLAGPARMISDVARCLLVDVPNHGRSAWTEEFDYEFIADLIADELSVRGALDDPVILVGHSMGGKLAICLTLDHPELVTKLCVVDIAPVSYSDSDYFENLLDAMAGLDLTALDSRGDADRALSTAIPDERVRGFVLQNLHQEQGPRNARPGRWSWLCNLALLRANTDVLSGFPDLSGSHWDGPVLWVSGENSGYVQPEYRPPMHELFPMVKEVVIPGAAHWVHADQPTAFGGVLRDFVLA
ncbi:alpha/beta fold hydrolase [Propionibacterium sp.]|uniref:alpha/beta fold hydrolase n=1 Tax=Propionibacterium sp. TaxID=1977903 RepID=UPI0039E99AC3